MKRIIYSKKRGFLLLEMLISALILAGAVAAGMYLFRTGFQYLEKIEVNNILSAKVPQATTYLLKEAPLEREKGSLSLGEGVTLSWKAERLEKVRPQIRGEFEEIISSFELYLYQVDFSLSLSNHTKTYRIFVFRYKSPFKSEEFF
jgi:hypothetical protein